MGVIPRMASRVVLSQNKSASHSIGRFSTRQQRSLWNQRTFQMGRGSAESSFLIFREGDPEAKEGLLLCCNHDRARS